MRSRTKKKKLTKPAARIAQHQVVREALALLNEGGIDAVSTRKLAQRLGISGPSLYWHFKNKRELLDHMAGAMLAEHLALPDATPVQDDWREWLTVSGRSMRQAMTAYRDGAEVIASSRPTGQHPVMVLGDMIQRLRSEGFSTTEAGYVLLSLMRFVLGAAVAEQANVRRDGVKMPEAAFEFGLATLILGFEAKLAQAKARRKARLER
ncbi:MAG TPA: TetR/AcrR family transcriptional regulator C-terminal domain-containing protein [Rhizomicrobium sp.]|nr:TetR/AcrR family transcriptional regulator C-terminal domain-containing protein [Rhizomicrobium sp.]